MADGSSPVLPDRKTMDYIERRLKEFKMQLGPMKRGPKRWPRKGGGGGSVTVATQYAVVTETAPSATYSGSVETDDFSVCLGLANYGKCVLLQLDGNNCYAMPEPEQGQTMADYELNLQCIYSDAALLPDRFIEVSYASGSTEPIPAGPYGEDPPVVEGQYVQKTDYLRALQGIAAEKILWTPDGDVIEWAGGECP